MIGKLIVHQPTREAAIACMRRALAELRVDGIKTTASFGLTSTEHGVRDPQELLQKADIALYEAKHSGRNQVVDESRLEAVAAAG